MSLANGKLLMLRGVPISMGGRGKTGSLTRQQVLQKDRSFPSLPGWEDFESSATDVSVDEEMVAGGARPLGKWARLGEVRR